jgi:ribosomal peptide maturation radical SAM protein 1
LAHDVILVVSPFVVINCPWMGHSVLVPQLHKRGISAKVYYANIQLARDIGPTVYDRFTDVATRGACCLGETLFLPWACSADVDEAARIRERLLNDWRRREPTIGFAAKNPDVFQLRKELDICVTAIPGFLEEACAAILNETPKIVGFSLSIPQMAGPMALAACLKAKAPHITIVAGGPHMTAPMGGAIQKAYGVFDFVFSGEADFAFPDFAERFLRTGTVPDTKLIQCAPIEDLDDVSVPDYDDYVEQIHAAFPSSAGQDSLVGGLFFEASRGCWWGSNEACTFCGLDSPSTPTRCKSPERLIHEIRSLYKRYGIRTFHTADVALPETYFETLLPQLASGGSEDLEMEVNVRPGLTKSDLHNLKRSGVTGMLVGIESFSTPLLRKINKGSTAHQNLCLLRDCRSLGIVVAYCLLSGIPQEDAEEYRSMINLIPKLEHFQPPRFLSTITLMRYSSYFSDAEPFGITDIRPSQDYAFLFGSDAVLDDIAYTFDATFPSEFLRDDGLRNKFRTIVKAWCDSWQVGRQLPVLRKVPVLPGTWAIQDTRRCRTREFYVPDEPELLLLDFLTTARKRTDLSSLQERKLNTLLGRCYVVEHEGLLQSVVTNLI